MILKCKCSELSNNRESRELASSRLVRRTPRKQKRSLQRVVVESALGFPLFLCGSMDNTSSGRWAIFTKGKLTFPIAKSEFPIRPTTVRSSIPVSFWYLVGKRSWRRGRGWGGGTGWVSALVFGLEGTRLNTATTGSGKW